MPADPTPAPDPKDPKATPAPDPTKDPKPDPAPVNDPEPDPDDLGPKGKAALDAERAARRKAEREAAETRRKLDEYEAANATEVDKAIKKARDEAAKETRDAMLAEMTETTVRARAVGKFADPEDAILHLLRDGHADYIVDGKVSDRAIDSAMDKILKAKPHLANRGGAAPLPGGGAKPSSAVSFNDEIRARAGRG